MTRQVFGLFAAAALLVSATGCQSECGNYCQKWEECINADLDADACVDACGDYASQDEKSSDDVHDCSVCIDENPQCSEVTSACWTQCLGIPNG